MRIDKVKALAHERLFIVENHAVQVDERLGVDKDAHIVELIDTVSLARLRVKADIVGKTGAAATRDAETQAALRRRNALLGHGDANALESALGHLNPLLVGGLVRCVEYGQLVCSHNVAIGKPMSENADMGTLVCDAR